MGKNVNRLLSGAMAVLMLGELVVQNSDPLVWSALKVSAETEAVVSEAEKADAEKTEATAEEPESGEKAAEYEDLTVSANKTLTGKTEVGNLTLTGGELNLNGYSLIVHGDVTINGGAVRMNKGELFCENFTMQNQYASFYMTNVNDHLVVNGNFTYTSGNMHDTFMTAGTIEVKGDFASTGGSFRPTGEHIVILNGKQKQTVTQSGMSSRFHTLDIENTAEEGVCSNATLFADIITGNLAQLHIGGSGEGGFVLEEDAALDSFYLVGGDLDLNGHTLTIKGDLTQAGGRVIPNGGTLNIGGDYRIATAKQTDDTLTYEYSTGYLMMTNEEDRVNVAGDFVTYSTQDHRSCMTAGILTIGGDFEQKRPNAYNNFYATGTHKTVFDGDKAHTVSFEETWGTAYCAFHDLDISGEEITIPLQAYVNGTLLGTDCKVTGMIDLFDTGVTGAQFDGNLRFRKNYTLTEDLTVNGNLDVNGNLNLDGHKLTVSGNVNNYSNINLNGGTLDCGGNYVNAYYYGSLTMKNEKDLLKVKGDYTHDGYYGSTLTNGRIMVGGNCTIGSSFNASEAHELILNGTAAQTLNVTSTGLQINKLVIENTGKEGVTVASVINVNEIQNAKNSKVQFAGGGQLGFKLTEDKTIEGDFDLAHGDLDLNGYKLTITGNLTQAGGRVIPNGGALTVNGDYRIATAKKTDDGVVYEQSTGWLVMTNEKDRVTVKGDFVTYSTQDHSSCMTAGILTIGGNFEQKRPGSYNNFYATGTHKTVFGGDKAHTVSFEESWGSAYCVFRDLDISGEEITIPLQAYMTGTLTHKDGTIKGCLDLCGVTVSGTVNGSLRFRSDCTLTADLTVKGNLDINGNLNLDGHTLTVTGNVTNSSNLNLNGGTLDCGGNYVNAYYYGSLTMKNEKDLLKVKGNYTHDGYYGSTLTNGRIMVGGNCTIGSSFNASEAHELILNGTAAQTLNVTSTGLQINKLILENTGKEGVTVASVINVNEIQNAKNSKVQFAGGGQLGFKLTEDKTIEGDFDLAHGDLDLNGHKLTITGNLTQAGGRVIPNGGALTVNGDYRIAAAKKTDDGVVYEQSTGWLVMTNEKDRVTVKGDFATYSTQDHSSCMTAGILLIGGNFEQKRTSSYNNFYATGTHKTVFGGDKAHTVSFEESWGTAYCVFRDLDINGEEITIPLQAYLTGTLTHKDGTIKGCLDLCGTTAGGTVNGSLRFRNDCTLTADLTVKGNLDINGNLNLNGHTLTVTGNVTNSSNLNLNGGTLDCGGNYVNAYYYGSLTMKNEKDLLKVKGDYTHDGYYGSTLTNGRIMVGGNCTIGSSFNASEAHELILNGTAAQTLNVTSTGLQINKLVLENTGAEGITIASAINVNALENTNGCKVNFAGDGEIGFRLTSDRTIEGDFDLAAGTLDLNGHKLTITGSLIQSGGTVNPNGGTLNIGGDYKIVTLRKTDDNVTDTVSTGLLIMKNEKDRVNVSGDFVTYSSHDHNGCLTAGVLTIGGNFLQRRTNSYNNFYAAGSHKTVFDGDKAHTIDFDESWNSAYCVFRNLDLDGETVSIPHQLFVTGDLQGENASVSGYVTISSLKQIQGAKFGGNISLTNTGIGEEVQLTQDMELGSLSCHNLFLKGHKLSVNAITVNGTVYPEGGMLEARSNLTLNTYANLSMQDPMDYIWIGGNFRTDSRNANDGMLKAGTIEIKGDFEQTYDTTFVTEDDCLVIMNGTNALNGRVLIQTIKFVNPEKSGFRNLQITKPLTEYRFLNGAGKTADPALFYTNLQENIIDQEPPEKVTGAAVTASQTTSVSLVWNAAKDNIGVMGYEIYRDSKKIFTTAKTEFTDAGLAPETGYVYEIYAFDACRNYSDASEKITAVTLKDTEAPTAPEDLRLLSKTGSSVTLAWNVSKDNVATTGYYIYCDGKKVAEEKDGLFHKVTGLETDKSYVFTVCAVDAAGNVSKHSGSVSAAPQKPKFDSVLPKEHAELGGKTQDITVRFANLGNSSDVRVDLEYKSADQTDKEYQPAAGYQVSRNAAAGFVTVVYNWALSGLKGDYHLRITLTDSEGNAASTVTEYFVDSSAPAAPSWLKAATKDGSNELQWDLSVSVNCSGYLIYRADEADGKYKQIAKIDNAMVARYLDSDVEAGKTYLYQVSAFSKFGVEGERTEAASVKVAEDKAPPMVLAIRPEHSRINGSVTIAVSTSDNLGMDRIKLEYKAAAAEAWTEIGEKETVNDIGKLEWNTADLPDGAYMLRAFAYDKNGNVSDEFTKAYTVDNSGPVQVEITPDECTAASSFVSIRWKDIEDADFGYYVVEQLTADGSYKEVGRTATTAGMHIENLAPETEYTFRVAAYDDLGNRGTASEPVVLKTVSDTVCPGIRSFYPAASAYSDKIDIEITAADNIAVQSVVLRYSRTEGDKKEWQPLTSMEAEKAQESLTFRYSFDLSELAEGPLFIEAVVSDTAGNQSKPVISQYQVDRTAPTAITDLKAVGTNGNVHLTWTTTDTDIPSFEIYRAEDGKTMLTKIADCTSKDFYDATVSFDTIYTYQIIAVDLAGNRSAGSNQAIAQAMADTEKPVVLGFDPKDGSGVGANPKMNVVVRDNNRLESVTVSYQADGADDAIWFEVGTYSLNTYYQAAAFNWDTEGLESGKYRMKAVAADVSGNVSEPYIAEFTLQAAAPGAPVLELFQGNREIRLEWSKPETEDLAGFVLYKRSSVQSDFREIGSSQDQLSYTDKNVAAGEEYFYKVRAYDKYNNFTDSNIMSGFAYDVDEEKPEAHVQTEIFAMAEAEVLFDATESRDDGRIAHYIWTFPDGHTRSGARVVETFAEAGDFDVELKLIDEAENETTETIHVHIYDRTQYGSAEVTVFDEKHVPVRYAYVYLYTEENGRESETTLRTDYYGKVTITKKIGKYRIAAYKQGYLPEKVEISIDQPGMTVQKEVTIRSGELVTGSLTVHRMTLEEMIEAHVDFNDPSNYHTFTFDIELTFAQEPIPTVIHYVGGGGGGGGGFGFSGGWGGGGGGGTLSDGSHVQVQPIVVQTEAEEPELILAYIRTSETISFMKEMYAVDLGVMNNATSDFVIEDCAATLELPSGLSLAATTTGTNTLRQKMDDIRGQESKTVSWVVRGDKKGEYNVSASFEGQLQPFNVPVRASFKTENPFTVGVGKGLHLYIYPESIGYIGKDYYIQYELRNEGSDPFYNLETSFGALTDPGYEEDITVIQPDGTREKLDTSESYRASYVIPDANKCPKIPVNFGNQHLEIGYFAPGDTLYGTYRTVFSGEGDPEEVRYRLIKSMITGLEETDIQVSVIPVPSHINKYNVQIRVVPTLFADPVDMTTGAFTDDIQALAVQGAFSELGLDLQYNSLNYAACGTVGSGWSHCYESYLDFRGNTINVHWNAANYATFVGAAEAKRTISGRLLNGNRIELTEDNSTGYKEYIPTAAAGMEGYKLVREDNGTYTLKQPGGGKLYFDAEGRLTGVRSEQDQTISITRSGNSMTITEDASGAFLTLNYSDDGLVTSVTDGHDRTAYLSYEDGRLTSLTNAIGDTVRYQYDEKGRYISATAEGEEMPYVVNEYDDSDRVQKQYDGLGNVSSFSYEELKDGGLKTTTIDRNGNAVTFTSDQMGRTVSLVDANGHETAYEYNNGNLTKEINSLGEARSYQYDNDNNLTAMFDYYGNATKMTYDKKGNVTKVDGSNGEHSTYTYNAHNLLESVTENTGVRRTYTYNENGQMLTESVSGLGVTYYTYNKNGRVTSVKDFLGNVKTLEYDAIGNLICETAPNGVRTKYEYDKLGRTIALTTEENTADGIVSKTVRYGYDARGNQNAVTDANGNTTHLFFDANNNVIKTVDAVGAVTTFEYDNEGRVVKTTFADGTVGTNTYDAAGNMLTSVNANGEKIEYAYNAVDQKISETAVSGKTRITTLYSYYPDGKLKTKTFADGTSETYTYDLAGRNTGITDQDGNGVTMQYDSFGNLVSTSDAEGNTTSYTYDEFGRRLTMKDPNGNVTTYDAYDANGNCTEMTNANGLKLQMEYSAAGELVKVISGESCITYEYDADGNVVKYTDEEGHFYTISYDANGNVLATMDADGNVVSENEYDAVNRVIKTTDALGIETEYTYNNVGQLKKMVENLNTAREKVTSYEYDDVGRLTATLDAEGGTASYETDGFGNVTAMIDPNGGRTEYTYDSMGRITETLNAIGSKCTYTYNAQGLLEEATNARKQNTKYTYLKNGWIESFEDELGKVSYKYDHNGNVTEVTDKNGTTKRTYNAMNQVTACTDFRGMTVSYGYDQMGNMVTVTYPGGRIVRYSYYKNGSLKSVTDWDDRETFYEYDGNGRLVRTTRPDGSVETRTYDAAGRLIKQVDVNGETVINARDYTYDEAGNIVAASMSNGAEFSALTNAVMEYDAANRLIKYNGEAVKYDADGNMIYGPVNGVMTALTYDCRNRLVSAGGITYEYDAENNRISKTIGKTKTSYVYDTTGSLSRLLTAETDGKTTYFVYGTGLVLQERDSDVLVYHFSNIGSTEALTNLAGEIVDRFEYGPYGELVSENKLGVMFLYNGEYGVATDENGLYYMRARYYSPEIKRFINQDVVIGSVTDSPSMNRYAYVQGNPISYIDPFGLSPSLGWKFWAHLGLSLLGNLMAIPTPLTMAIGAAAIIANTAWYAAEGDYYNAICSAVSVLTCGYSALSTAANTARSLGMASQYSCKFITALKYASSVSQIAIGGYDLYQTGKKVYNLAANGELTAGKLLMCTGEAVMASMSIADGLHTMSSKVSYCFVAGTPVETEDGQKPIEEIEAGDQVLSTDYETGETAYKTVLETYENETTELIHVHVNGEVIKATPSHPFYVAKFGWTKAADLRAGDVLVLSNGEYVVVEAVQHEILESPIKVYNFEVQDYHTYYVGENSVLVHNMCETDDVPSRKEALNQIKEDLGIPRSQQPISQEMVKLHDVDGSAIPKPEGGIRYSRELTYDARGLGLVDQNNNPLDTIVIQDHSYGHTYESGIGNQPSHFNVRPGTDPTGKVLFKETGEEVMGHYYFKTPYHFTKVARK